MAMYNWHFEIDTDNIAWLHADMHNSGANVLSPAMLEELDRQLLELSQHNPAGLALLSDKRSGFFAGADIKAFAGLRDRHAAEHLIRQAHEVFARLAALPFPSVALIHGFCLGGGLELALACDYRVASDAGDTRLGFPETRLGIFPAFAGTLRATALVGHLNALQMMLSNRSLDGREAQEIGLVDAVAPPGQLQAAARRLLTKRPPRHRPPLLQRLAGAPLVRSGVTALLRHELGKKVSADHYPAPYALLDHWNTSAGNPQHMAISEQQEVARLLTGDNAQNLVRVFMLQNMLKSQKGDPSFKPAHVHVVGGGLLGGDIAAWCALQGLSVSLREQQPARLADAVARAHRLFSSRLGECREAREAMQRVQPHDCTAALPPAEIVIEAIDGDAGARQELLATLEAQLGSDTLLVTTASRMPLASLAEKLQNPARLVGLHFLSPVADSTLLEVASLEASDSAMIDRALAFSRRIARLPLLVRGSPGYLVDRVLLPYLVEAMLLLEEGVPAAVVDHAAVAFGMSSGPLELADDIGLDSVTTLVEELGDALAVEAPRRRLAALVDTGKLGRCSGAGFHSYEQGKAVSARAPRGPVDAGLSRRLLAPLLNAAVACLREGVAADADSVDAGLIFGAGFPPFRGGPLRYIEEYGRERMLQELRQLQQSHGERFRPDQGWLLEW
jgi:3-hydroxyacyl-CoA dehydrogenase / enoyl-CoA hydratase / 3-hydroxybutyryl-CoA epimerase